MYKLKQKQENKKARIALRKIFGIGPHLANNICDIIGISDQKIKEVKRREMDRIVSMLTNSYYIDNELKKIIQADIERLKKIHCFRGIQHKK